MNRAVCIVAGIALVAFGLFWWSSSPESDERASVPEGGPSAANGKVESRPLGIAETINGGAPEEGPGGHAWGADSRATPALRSLLGTLQPSARGHDSGSVPAEPEDPQVTHTLEGYVHSLIAGPGMEFPVKGAKPGNPEETAKQFLDSIGELIGASGDAIDWRLRKWNAGEERHSIRMTQTYEGIPVYGGEVVVQVNDGGGVEFFGGNFARDLGDPVGHRISATPELTATEASELARQRYATAAAEQTLSVTHPELNLFVPSLLGIPGPMRLAWHVEVRSADGFSVAQKLFLDAHSGELAWDTSMILGALSREIRDSEENPSKIPGELLRLEGEPPSADPEANTAYDYMGLVYTWFLTNFERDGWKPEGGHIYTSSDSGLTWTQRDSKRNWTGLASSANGTKLVGVVGGGRIYTSADSGMTWTARESERQWSSVASSADGTKLVASVFNGKIYTSSDSGATWTEQPGAGSRFWRAVTSSTDGSKLAAVANNDQIYTSTDSGSSWTARESNRKWSAITSSSDGTKLAATAEGEQIYISSDSGVSWTGWEATRQWASIASSGDGMKLVAGDVNSILFVSSDSGIAWERPGVGNHHWSSAAVSDNGMKLAATARGNHIFTSSDGGENWTPRGSKRDWGSIASSSDGNKLVAAETVREMTLNVRWGGAPNAAWTGDRLAFGKGGPFIDDVMAHEWMHAVIAFESALEGNTPIGGAINESISDVFGEYFDQTNNTPPAGVADTDTPAVKWQLFEDDPSQLPRGYGRSMRDPKSTGGADRLGGMNYDPMGNKYNNAGVNNKLCYLLVDGSGGEMDGKFEGYTVGALGYPAVAALYYEANLNLLTKSSQWAELATSLRQAAINIGWTSFQRLQLENGMKAVGFNSARIIHVDESATGSTEDGTTANPARSVDTGLSLLEPESDGFLLIRGTAHATRISRDATKKATIQAWEGPARIEKAP